MPATATFAVWDALTTVIRAEPLGPVDSDSNPLLNSSRVYRGKVPPVGDDQPDDVQDLSYFLLGQRSESEEGFYAQRGQFGAYRIHCWSDTPDNAGRLYAWLKDLLHDVRLTVTDHAYVVGGQLRWISEQPDPDGTAWQVVADYTVSSLEDL